MNFYDTLEPLQPSDFAGFFQGWQRHPTPKQHFQILQSSFAFIIAYDSSAQKVAGFINCISDGMFYAFIPLLEVRREYQQRGIGSTLVQRMRVKLSSFYAVDAITDSELTPFYTKLGFIPVSGLVHRNYECRAFAEQDVAANP